MLITVTDVQLYRWYRMGIVDYEDLQWLLQFYHNIHFPLSLVGFSVMIGKRYFENACADDVPIGYWPRLMQSMSTWKTVEEDDSTGPDPIV